MTDIEKVRNIKQFVTETFNNQDYIFDFDADFLRLLKTLNIKRLQKNDKKYMKKFSDTISAMYRKVYLKEVINAGVKQGERFIRIFANG